LWTRGYNGLEVCQCFFRISAPRATNAWRGLCHGNASASRFAG
jgi:hypothetical protein